MSKTFCLHPFADGNGRTGRLWQSLILQNWKEIFAWIPVETFVHENQEEYYKALQSADKIADSTKFAEFMLTMIRDALKEISEGHSDGDVAINVVTNAAINAITAYSCETEEERKNHVVWIK